MSFARETYFNLLSWGVPLRSLPITGCRGTGKYEIRVKIVLLKVVDQAPAFLQKGGDGLLRYS